MGLARPFPAGTRLRDNPAGDDRVWFVRSGWLARARWLEDGRRQIIGLALPGEHTQPYGRRTGVASLTGLSLSEVAGVAVAEVERARAQDAELAAWFVEAEHRWSALLEERIVSLGRRNAEERLAYVFCEVLTRLHITASVDAECKLPLTQADLADYLGLSLMHLNRTLQSLRRTGLIEFGRGSLKVTDVVALQRAAHFEAIPPRSDVSMAG